MKKLTILFSIIFTVTIFPAMAALQVGAPAPDFALENSAGETISLSDFKGKNVVLEWSNYECPYVRKHYDGGNMQGLQEKYTGKDVVWLTIISSAKGKQGYFEGKELTDRIASEKSKSTHVLVDASGVVGKKYAATNTPQMVVITTDSNVAYSGAIDSIPSANKDDIAKAENYVVAALDSILAGEKVATPLTRPYGCGVKYDSVKGYDK